MLYASSGWGTELFFPIWISLSASLPDVEWSGPCPLRPFVTCFKALADKSLVGAILVTGLPLFSIAGPCPRTVSWGGTVSRAAVRRCVLVSPVEVGTFLCLHPIW